MNAVFLDGHLVSNAELKGKQTKILAFTVETKQPNGDKEDHITHLPCVMFNPDQAAEDALTKGKGLYVVIQGRLNSSRNGDDKPKFTEVVVFNRSLVIVRRQ